MILHEHKLLYVHIPKVAGTSIERAFGFNHNEYSRDISHDHRTMRHYKPFALSDVPGRLGSMSNFKTSLQQVKLKLTRHSTPNMENMEWLTRQQADDYFKMTFVRNPWARAYSWYNNVMNDKAHRQAHGIGETEKLGLTDFLVKCGDCWGLNSQLYWLVDYDGSTPFDYIGYFESLSDSFAKACELAQVKGRELPHLYASKKPKYPQAYDDTAKDLIAERYQKEIEMFGYRFEGRVNDDIHYRLS